MYHESWGISLFDEEPWSIGASTESMSLCKHSVSNKLFSPWGCEWLSNNWLIGWIIVIIYQTQRVKEAFTPWSNICHWEQRPDTILHFRQDQLPHWSLQHFVPTVPLTEQRTDINIIHPTKPTSPSLLTNGRNRNSLNLLLHKRRQRLPVPFLTLHVHQFKAW